MHRENPQTPSALHTVVGIFKEFSETPIEFFPLHRKLTGRLTSAILLAYLLRQFRYFKSDKIYNTDAEVMQYTTLTEKELRTAKDHLKTKSYLTITREGGGGRTHYEINWENMAGELLVLKSKEVDSDSPIGRNSVSPIGRSVGGDVSPIGRNPLIERNTKRVKLHSPTPNTAVGELVGELNSEVVDNRWKRMAAQLCHTIFSVRKISCTSKVHSWAKFFQLLHTVEKVPTPRIRKVLDWYCQQYPTRHGERYFHVVHSGDAFNRKFLEIEQKMQRELQEHPDPSAPKLPTPDLPIEVLMRKSVDEMTNREYDRWKAEIQRRNPSTPATAQLSLEESLDQLEEGYGMPE